MDAEIERRWLHSLSYRWERINLDYVDGELEPPQFMVDSAQTRLGRWDPRTRTIGISRAHLENDTWAEIDDTLRHEIAHQVVSELFAAEQAPPHGELFRRACRMLGMDRAPQVGEEIAAPEHVRILQRVQKLLSLSTSQNPHEAQAAMSAANRLLLKHNLEIADAEQAEDVSWRFVGKPSGRVSLAQKLTAGILQEFFFVRCVWVGTQDGRFRNVRKLEIFGRRHNLDFAEYVHDFLTRTLDHLWQDYRKRSGAKGAALKNEYVVGVLTGFREHLSSQRDSQAKEGLVWLGDPAVAELMSERHGRLKKGRGGRYRVGRAHQAGKEAGRQLRIRPGVREGEPENRGRRLK